MSSLRQPLVITRADRAEAESLRPLLAEVAALQRKLRALGGLADWRALAAAPEAPGAAVALWQGLAALRAADPSLALRIARSSADRGFRWALDATGPPIARPGISALAAAPYGSVLAVAPSGADRPWWIRSPEAAVIPEGSGHRDGRRYLGIGGLAWSRDGSRLASAQEEDRVQIWDWDGSEARRATECISTGGGAVAWLSTDVVLSPTSDATTAWDARTGGVVREWPIAGTAVSASPAGTAAIAVLGASSGLWVVDAASEERERIPGRFDGFAYGASGALAMVRRGGSGEVRGLDGDGRTFAVAAGDGRRRPMAWSPDRETLAVALGRWIELVRPDRPNEVLCAPAAVDALAFSADGALVAGFPAGSGWSLGFWRPS